MRLIDAHRLIEELNEAQVEGDELYKGLGKAKVIVCYQPTVDAVLVVRCKDCKHYDEGLCCKGTYDLDDNEAFSHFYPFAAFEDDYCSRGERKDETK